MGLLDQELIPPRRKTRLKRTPATRESLKALDKRTRSEDGRRAALKSIPMPKYKAYIKSDAWRERCRKFFEKYGRKCAACGSGFNITVHHMAYTHMGNELDEELAVFCSPCHLEYHEANGTQRDMIAKTTAFIVDKQQLASLPAL